MNKIISFFCLTALLLSMGCNSYKTAIVKSKYVNANGTTHLPLLVDLIVDDSRVSGTFSCKNDLGVEYAKSQAVAAALKKSGADVLFQPQYLIENTGSFLNVDVSGHPAHYKNFRPATVPTDSLQAMQQLNIVQPQTITTAPVTQPVTTPVKTKKH